MVLKISEVMIQVVNIVGQVYKICGYAKGKRVQKQRLQGKPSAVFLARLAGGLKGAVEDSDTLHGTQPLGDPRDIVAFFHKRCSRLLVKLGLEQDGVGHELVVKPCFGEGGSQSHVVLDDVPQGNGGGGNDA